jgi:hypothetical protein
VTEVSQISVEGLQVIGERQGAIAQPFGGTVVDVESRAVLAQILAALQAHRLIAA